MSIKDLKALQARASVSDDEMAELIGIKTDQLQRVLAGDLAFGRIHNNGLDQASLHLAITRRDPSLLTRRLRKRIERLNRIMRMKPTLNPKEQEWGDDWY